MPRDRQTVDRAEICSIKQDRNKQKEINTEGKFEEKSKIHQMLSKLTQFVREKAIKIYEHPLWISLREEAVKIYEHPLWILLGVVLIAAPLLLGVIAITMALTPAALLTISVLGIILGGLGLRYIISDLLLSITDKWHNPTIDPIEKTIAIILRVSVLVLSIGVVGLSIAGVGLSIAAIAIGTFVAAHALIVGVPILILSTIAFTIGLGIVIAAVIKKKNSITNAKKTDNTLSNMQEEDTNPKNQKKNEFGPRIKNFLSNFFNKGKESAAKTKIALEQNVVPSTPTPTPTKPSPMRKAAIALVTLFVCFSMSITVQASGRDGIQPQKHEQNLMIEQEKADDVEDKETGLRRLTDATESTSPEAENIPQEKKHVSQPDSNSRKNNYIKHVKSYEKKAAVEELSYQSARNKLKEATKNSQKKQESFAAFPTKNHSIQIGPAAPR